MLLQLAAWPEVEAYLRSSTAIIVPIAAIHSSGPFMTAPIREARGTPRN